MFGSDIRGIFVLGHQFIIPTIVNLFVSKPELKGANLPILSKIFLSTDRFCKVIRKLFLKDFQNIPTV
jgi:hypothetical protein